MGGGGGGVQETSVKTSEVEHLQNRNSRNAKNLSFQKSNKKLAKFEKLSKPIFSRLWKLNKDLQQFKELLFKKNDNLSRNSELCDILTCPIFIILSQLHGSLEKIKLTTTVTTKITSLAENGRNKTGLDLPKSLTRHYQTCQVAPWKSSILRAYHYLT